MHASDENERGDRRGTVTALIGEVFDLSAATSADGHDQYKTGGDEKRTETDTVLQARAAGHRQTSAIC